MRETVLAHKTRRTFGRVNRDESEAFRVPRRTDKVTCRKCDGRGKRSFKKGHKPDCACVGCKPCNDCKGTGRFEEERRGKEHRNVEVEFEEE